MKRSLAAGYSFSGHERNHFFLSSQGKRFTDVSALSGLDHIGDSRMFSLLDYDRDGYQDIVLVNANAPTVQLYRNRIGELDDTLQGDIVAVRLVGGSQSVTPTSQWSNRDGYGTRVIVTAGELQISREHRCGEGYGAQNSTTMLIGVGTVDHVDLEVHWPSGQTSRLTRVRTGSLATIFENPAHSPGSDGHQIAPYRRTLKAE